MRVSADRIKERLTALGKTEYAACKEAQIGVDTIRNIRRGRAKNTQVSTLIKLATVLQCSAEYLIGIVDNIGSAPSSGTNTQQISIELLPVLYEVGAGLWRASPVSPLVGEAGPVAPSPKYRGVTQWLERVAGNGADERFQVGELAHVVDALKIGYSPRPGDYIVVSWDHNGLNERSLRRVTLAPGMAVQLVCPSRDPRFDTILNWPTPDGSVVIVGKVIGRYSSLD